MMMMTVGVDRRPGSHVSKNLKNVGPQGQRRQPQRKRGVGELDHVGPQHPLPWLIQRSDTAGFASPGLTCPGLHSGLPSAWSPTLLRLFKILLWSNQRTYSFFTPEAVISPPSDCVCNSLLGLSHMQPGAVDACTSSPPIPYLRDFHLQLWAWLASWSLAEKAVQESLSHECGRPFRFIKDRHHDQTISSPGALGSGASSLRMT